MPGSLVWSEGRVKMRIRFSVTLDLGKARPEPVAYRESDIQATQVERPNDWIDTTEDRRVGFQVAR